MKSLRHARSASGARNGPIFPVADTDLGTLTFDTLLDVCVRIKRVPLQGARVR